LFYKDLARSQEDLMADQGFVLLEAHGGDTVGYCHAQVEEARSRGDWSMVAYWGSMAKLAAMLSQQRPAHQN
jgi:hypothetical protein